MLDQVEAWLRRKVINEGKSEQTATKYRYYLTLLAEFFTDKNINYKQANRTQLEEFVGLYLHKRNLAPRSRRTAVAAVKGFFTYMFDEGHCPVNPAKALPYPAGANKIPVAMGLKNYEKLLQQCDLNTFTGVRDAAMLALLGGCGIRLAGLVGLNQSNIVVYEYNNTDRLAITVMEKGKKERQIPVPLEAQVYLRVYIGHPELKNINRTLPNGDLVLFVSTQNRNVNDWDYYGEARRLSPRSVQKMLTKLGEQAGVPANQCHPHALRHLTGAEYAEEELDLITRQILLGHSDPATTAIYTQMALRKLTAKVDNANPLSKVQTAVSPLIDALRNP